MGSRSCVYLLYAIYVEESAKGTPRTIGAIGCNNTDKNNDD